MKTTNKIFFLIISLLFISCEDVFEEDITDDVIVVVSPKENTTIESNVVNFQWKDLEGAKKYRVQVLDLSETVVIDSLVTKTNLNCPLASGTYKWKVRGENFAYESNYSAPSIFSMNVSDDLTNQQVVLSSPDNNIYFNTSAVTVKWQNLQAASSYSVEVVNTTSGESVYKDENVTQTSVALSSSYLKEDAQYQWKVRGINSFSETLQFSTRNFYIDTAVPSAPQNSLPATNATISNNITTTFSWVSPTDTGAVKSPLVYTIEFSNTEAFTSIYFTTNTTTTSYQHAFTVVGDYYWRVKTTDAAKNTSAYSTAFKFTLI